MRLALSSGAAPDATFAELLESAVRRGFAALELVEGHAHGVDRGISTADALEAAATAASASVPIAAFRTDDVAEPGLPALAGLAAALDAPVVAGGLAVRDDDWIRLAAPHLVSAGVDLLLQTDGSQAELIRARRTASHWAGGTIGLAWEVDPASARLDAASEVLATAGDLIRQVRLRGGGPESIAQTGMGVGTLMSALALHAFDGVIALAPSTARYRYAWSAWLGRRGGWGCGSKTYERELATLTGVNE